MVTHEADIFIKRDADIPAPPPKTRHHRRLYPWAELEIGESFFAPVTFIDTEREQLKRKTKYVKRRQIEDGVRGFRVWRIE